MEFNRFVRRIVDDSNQENKIANVLDGRPVPALKRRVAYDKESPTSPKRLSRSRYRSITGDAFSKSLTRWAQEPQPTTSHPNFE